MKRWWQSVFFVCVLASGGCVHLMPEQAAARDRILGEVQPCVKAVEPVRVDGVLDDAVWQAARPITNFYIPVTWRAPRVHMRGWLAYDRENLYVAFELLDPDLEAPAAEHDGPLYFGDVAEVFLKPRASGCRYTEIEISPQGAILDATFSRRRYTPKSYAWTCAGLRSATTIQGTLNHDGDRDTGWCAEMAIPFASLPDTGGVAPTNGATWNFNLAGYNFSSHLPGGQELVSSSPLCVNVFRRYQDWLTLRFE